MAEHDLLTDLTPVVEGLGFSLIECKAQGVKGMLHVHMVVHRTNGGVSIDDCAEIHRTVRPRIEVLTGRRELNVEVASPGTDRKFKKESEYRHFVGMRVRILDLENEWRHGTLSAVDDEGITLSVDGRDERLAWPEIRSGRLDDL